MKQIRQKNDKAVSPIIATILLIAITVVLAATLVTILGGFTHGVGNTVEIAGATVFEGKSTSSSGTYILYLNISSSSSNISSSQITLLCTPQSGSSSSFSLKSSSVKGPNFFNAGSDYIITSSHQVKSIELTYKGSSIYSSGLITIS